MGKTKDDAWKTGLVDFKGPDGTAMVLNLGKATERAFIYLTDDATTFKQVSLTYDIGNGQVTIVDKSFPWEFTIPLEAETTQLDFKVSGLAETDKRTETAVYHLSKNRTQQVSPQEY
jgi:hypothetical protein